MEPSTKPEHEWYDLSIPIRTNIYGYPGDPPVKRHLSADYAKDGYRVTAWRLGSHTGTHVDAPSHFIPGGSGVDAINLQALLGDAYVVDARHKNPGEEIDTSYLPTNQLPKRLLFCFGWDQSFSYNEFFFQMPGLSAALVDELIARGVLLIGTDAPNIHATDWVDLHRKLLAAGVVIVERLHSLDRFVGKNIELVVAPLCLVGSDGAPARVFARVAAD